MNKKLSIPPVDYFVHSTVTIDDQVTIGKGTKIWHFSHILSGSIIGKRCNIGQNVVVGLDVNQLARDVRYKIMSVFIRVLFWKTGFFVDNEWFLQMYLNQERRLRKWIRLDQTM